MLVCGAVFMAIPVLSSAKDFPLEFKTLNAQEAMAFPGGAGIYGTIQPNKPAGIRKEPAAISKHPLYGELNGQTVRDRLYFRLDESKGDGKGYDRLIVDMNQNGDLTDDAVAVRVEQPGSSKTTSPSQQEIAIFGPIAAPNDKMIGSSRPIYFAQMYLFTPPAGVSSNVRIAYFGQLRFKAGWYLEATVEFDGTKRKVGIIDANCNLQLGDIVTPTTYSGGSETSWYFQNGDYFLQDITGSGKFKNTPGDSASSPFGPMLYLGAKPYKATLSADCKSLALDPWAEPLAELAIQPHGEQVNVIQVAWESSPGKWQLLQPGVENGKAKVPPGNYRLYACTLKVKTSGGDSLILSGYKLSPKDTVKAEAGVPASFKCGSPLDVKVTSSARETAAAGGSQSLLGRIARNLSSSDQTLEQLIQASVVGAGGESYSSFVLEDKNNQRQPPSPTFAVATSDGREVGSGNMEFG